MTNLPSWASELAKQKSRDRNKRVRLIRMYISDNLDKINDIISNNFKFKPKINELLREDGVRSRNFAEFSQIYQSMTQQTPRQYRKVTKVKAQSDHADMDELLSKYSSNGSDPLVMLVSLKSRHVLVILNKDKQGEQTIENVVNESFRYCLAFPPSTGTREKTISYMIYEVLHKAEVLDTLKKTSYNVSKINLMEQTNLPINVAENFYLTVARIISGKI